MADDDQDEQYMTMDEVLGELDVAEDELKKMVSEGKLRAFRSQNKMKFREQDVDSLRGDESGAEDEIEFPAEEGMDQQETLVDGDMDDITAAGEEDETLEIGGPEGDEEDEIDLGSLDEELVLDEEEDDPGETPETEEVIFEEDDLDAMADEEETTFEQGETLVDGSGTSETLEDDEFDLGEDEDSTLLDEEFEEEVETGSTQVVDDGGADEQSPAEPGTTAQQTKQQPGPGPQQQTKQTTGQQTQQTQQKQQTGQRTATRRRPSPRRQKQSVNMLWTVVLVVGVLVMMETVLIGVDLARMSALQTNEPDPVQVEPWPTSRLASPLLDMFFDGKVSLKPKPVLKRKGKGKSKSSENESSPDAADQKQENGSASSPKK